MKHHSQEITMVHKQSSRIISGLAILAGLAIAFTAASAPAATVQVDIQSDGTDTDDAQTQSGWNAWELSETFGSNSHSNTFNYVDTTDGTLDVTLTPSGTTAGARNYDLDNVTDPGNLSIPNVWFDQYFTDSPGSDPTSLTLTLDDLKAGTYLFTSFHYGDNLAAAREGTASVFVNSVDTGEDVTFVTGVSSNVSGGGNPSAADIENFGTLMTTFIVANDNDTVTISYQGLTGGDRIGLNGFEVSVIPTPAALPAGLALLALTAMRRRRH